MFQYLIDDYLPGYSLPMRRLTAYPWRLDPSTCRLKLGYSLIIDITRLGDAVAIRGVEYHYIFVLCNDGNEYRVWECQRSDTGELVYDHLCHSFDIPKSGVESYLM
jgi:hypothetical protein